jgi:GTP-binding protein
MKIVSAEFLKSSTKLAQCPSDMYPEFAFIGRSNVGKSSLINMLVQKKGLAKTSSNPGKTQTINHFLINRENKAWFVVDLPGYGYARVAKTSRANWRGFTSEYLLKRRQLICACVLIDARLQPQAIDIEFITWLGEEGVPFIIILTKADKMKPGALEENTSSLKNQLLEIFSTLPAMFISSAETRLGREDILGFFQSHL